MKYAVPFCFLLAFTIVGLRFSKKNSSNDSWNQHQIAMNDLKRHLGNCSSIGMPVDKNHVIDAYSCRYWLAPTLVLPDDSQQKAFLIVAVKDQLPVKSTGINGGDTLWRYSNERVNYFLIAKR